MNHAEICWDPATKQHSEEEAWRTTYLFHGNKVDVGISNDACYLDMADEMPPHIKMPRHCLRYWRLERIDDAGRRDVGMRDWDKKGEYTSCIWPATFPAVNPSTVCTSLLLCCYWLKQMSERTCCINVLLILSILLSMSACHQQSKHNIPWASLHSRETPVHLKLG